MSRSGLERRSSTLEDRFSGYLSMALRPMPLLAGLTAGGLAVIYAMALFGIMEPLGWQLPAAAVLLLAVALLHRPIVEMARRGHGLRAFWIHSAVTVAAGLGLAFLWDGASFLTILTAWIAPIISMPARLPRRRYAPVLVLSVVGTAVILLAANQPGLARLPSNTGGSIAAVLLVTSMVVLFILQVIATQAFRYRALESRLIGSLVPIIAVPILFTTSIAAFNAFTSSQQQFHNSLEAVSSLKRGQLNAIVQAVFSDLSSIQEGSQGAPNIMHVLQRQGAADDEFRLNASLAATQIRNVIVMHPAGDYEEVLVLDTRGNAILSTDLLNQGFNFGDQEFFRQALTAPTARFIRYPGKQNAAGEYKLVGAVPFFGETPDQLLGVVVAVASPEAFLNVLQPTMGLEDVSTYLVDAEMNAVAPSALPAGVVQADAIESMVARRSGGGSSSYRNYAGVSMLGYYDWDPALQAAIVSEVPQNVVFGRSLAAVLTSGLVGLLTIIIAIIAMLSTSRTIIEPVTELAQAAELLAAGQLGTRASTDREDEFGRLAASFNSMADQLQAIIGNLERRVADRTRELESQTLRLRTAAEIARDASLAPTLEELLERAARLVLDRFGVDHVGIYLMDEKRQYAVLQAAPSGAGQRMLAANFRVPVGDRGSVGQAATTGEAQLVLKGSSEVDIGDEYHTVTQSQLSLPLRTTEGTIGLLDLQTDKPQAFTPADVAIIQVLADQLAAAIERVRLLLQVQERLGQLEQSNRRFTQESWGAYGQTGPRPLGYRYNNVRLDPVRSIPEGAQPALESGTKSISGDKAADGSQTTFIPIRLRDQTLGVITANFREGRAPARTLAMLEQAADRLGTALENVRLLEESMRRAAKERLIGEITAKISSSISVRNVLQTAVEELGRALPGSDVSIKFRAEAVAREKETPK